MVAVGPKGSHRLGGEALKATGDVPLAAGWSLQGKVNNLTNRSYETAWGYNQPGRSLYLTLRWQPK